MKRFYEDFLSLPDISVETKRLLGEDAIEDRQRVYEDLVNHPGWELLVWEMSVRRRALAAAMLHETDEVNCNIARGRARAFSELIAFKDVIMNTLEGETEYNEDDSV